MLRKFILIFCLTMVFNSHANSTEAFKVVQDFFAATSANDLQAVRNSATKDFQLLEIDEIWDMDFLINLMEKANKEVKRRNFFKVVKQVNNENMIWISYWNKAEFSFKDNPPRPVFWLESVVLIKQNNHWLIQMLHSSRVPAEKLPKDIKFEEYI